MKKVVSVPVLVSAVGLMVAFGPAARHLAAQDALAAARGMYAAAAYEEALTVLNGLRADAARADDRPRIEEYRAVCLLALGRGPEAEQAIEALVQADPSYRPSETELSPRVRATFAQVRSRLLPGLVQQRYGAAKEAFDRKQHAAAAEAFSHVLALLADPDLGAAAGQSPLADVRTLAIGFRELAAAAAAPPPPPPPPPAPEPKPIAPPETPPLPVEPRIYAADDAGVTPPVAVRQVLPPFPPNLPLGPTRGGVLEVVIDERGEVESAAMKVSISPAYDRLVLAQVRDWRFRAATRMGTPVKYRKLTHITVQR